jgi:ABC-type Fe3+-hydroxamate transport system substrate-binding protein
MAVIYDQLNRAINLPAIPKRIISVVPSQTELLFYLGLTSEVIGITKFCIHPVDRFKSITKVGGTKQLDINKIKELKPDLIIANKEENDRQQIEQLTTVCPVWISDISNFDEAMDMIVKVGELVDRASQAKALSTNIQQQFSQLKTSLLNLRAAYLIWRKPYMAAGRQTFIDDMLRYCGLTNAFSETRYPEIMPKMLVDADPDVVLLSSEPYPFVQKHVTELKVIVPNTKIILVDGEVFSWYGSRLLHAPAYFKQLIAEITAR